MTEREQYRQVTPKKFGAFLGVFTPSVLTILGLIMFLRFGWVAGNVGLGWTLVIVILASSITFITGLSASAIATNMLVGVGGEYYMISRSLGLELGGAIGIPLYFCRTLSVTFYSFGLSETFMTFWTEVWGSVPGFGIQLIAAGIIILITILSGSSAELVLKVQVPIMVLVGLAILALITGVLIGPLKAPSLEANYLSAPRGFWYVFAVFFPAVTGFTAGIGMSGDLKDPKKSIPIGTLGAILTCLIIYILILVALSVSGKLGTSDLTDITHGIENWTSTAIFGGIFIIPAVLGAILSSAFGSILSGPRVLQALSTDGLAPKIFGKLSKSGQPTLATWMTGAIALFAVLLGELNTVAILVSVLFLTLYVAINLSAAIEVLVSEPHYRPTIRVPWYISVLGALGAIFVMFLISPIACLIAVVIEIAVYTYLRRKSLEQQWGDVISGMWLNVAKRALMNHNRRKKDPRNWRPQILLFAREINHSIPLVKLGAVICQGKGLLTICNLLTIDEHPGYQAIEILRTRMQDDISKLGIEAFCEVNVVRDLKSGTLETAKAHGIAGLKSNTIMEGWSEDPTGRINQLIKLKEMAQAGKNILYTRFRKRNHHEVQKKMTIWWRGKERNADLMLLLAHLIQLNPEYSDHIIEINSVVSALKEAQPLKLYIEEQLRNERIKGVVNILVSTREIKTVIKERSRQSEFVFIGLPTPGKGKTENSANWISEVSEANLTTLFVYNAGMANAVPQLLK
jgi:amino acid transporter